MARTCDGRRIFGTRVRPAQNSSLSIRHYVFRSEEDYIKKSLKGFVDASGAEEIARRVDLLEREKTKHNDVLEPMPIEYVKSTKDALQRYGFSSPYI